MKHSYFFLIAMILILSLAGKVLANSAPVVSNVTASQRSDDSKLVDIYYNLSDADGDSCTIWVAVSNNGGASWRVPARTFTGDIGSNVTPGINKSIVWDAGADMPGKVGDFKVRVYADDGNAPESMVLVPASWFPYQNVDWVYVDSFMMGKFEITNSQYVQFLNNADPNGDHWISNMEIDRYGDPGSYTYEVHDGKENYPIRYPNFYDAEAYCTWLSGQTGLTYRLPSHHEWEKAAGWDPVEPHYYTYGFHQDTISCSWCNYNNCYGGPLLVGSFNGTGGKENAKSYYGCYDMSGNVREWTTEVDGSYRVIRGGFWGHDAASCAVTDRGTSDPSDHNNTVGFRLVLDLD